MGTFTKYAANQVLELAHQDGYTKMTPRVLNNEIVDRIHEAGPDDASLEWVAYLYRIALLTGEPPTKAVEDALNLSRASAGRWVAKARDRDYLGPAEGPGKVGG